MKVFPGMFFLCLILIITSLYHLYYYGKCKNEHATLRTNLQQNENINNSLYNKYSEALAKHKNLKKVAVSKLYLERNLANENNRHAVAMSNVIPLQYIRLLEKSSTPNPIALENHYNGLKSLKGYHNSVNEKSKEVANTICKKVPDYRVEGNSRNSDINNIRVDGIEDDKIIVSGETQDDSHPYQYGKENDNIFSLYNLNMRLSDKYPGFSGGSGNTGGIGSSIN